MKYTFWLKTSAVLQILTACIHSLSFVAPPQFSNDTEEQMFNLMTTYKMAMGNGFQTTMFRLFNSMSISFVLFLLLGGVITFFLLKQKAEIKILKGYVLISTIFYGLCFIAMIFLTFLPPIACTGLIFLALLITYISIPRNISVTP